MEISKQIQRILSVFFLTDVSAVHVQYFNLKYKNNELDIQHENVILKTEKNLIKFESKKNIMAIENKAKQLGSDKIKEIIYNSNIDQFSGFAVFCNREELNSTINLITALKKFRISYFGVNPDYYFSLVPLDSKNRRNIEKYIFDLTSEATWIEQFKKFVKKAMIYLGLSNRLYESFVIISIPIIK